MKTLLFILLGSLSLQVAKGKLPPDLNKLIKKAHQEGEIPAIAVAKFDPTAILVRKDSGHTTSAQTDLISKNSKWHLGSDAKAMTATLLARLVERDLLKWETTMAEIFPNLSSVFDDEAAKITVIQLLSHTSGLPANPSPYGRLKPRLQITEIGLSKAPDKPENGFRYSNFGYIIAGAIVEEKLGITWEEAIVKEVFKPLGIKSYGFGAPDGEKVIRGHRNGKPMPTKFGGDNPMACGPAGGLHLSLSDWILFLQDQINGHHGNGKLLKTETYRKLHTPVSKGYALGWGVTLVDDKPAYLSHDGSNTFWYARTILDLRKRRGLCVLANSATSETKEWVAKLGEALR